MHEQKMDMSDETYVINVGGDIGESTKKETLKEKCTLVQKVKCI